MINDLSLDLWLVRKHFGWYCWMVEIMLFNLSQNVGLSGKGLGCYKQVVDGSNFKPPTLVCWKNLENMVHFLCASRFLNCEICD